MSAKKVDDPTARIYPCQSCGVMRSKDEGGTTFTVCDECWHRHFGGDAKERRRRRAEQPQGRET